MEYFNSNALLYHVNKSLKKETRNSVDRCDCSTFMIDSCHMHKCQIKYSFNCLDSCSANTVFYRYHLFRCGSILFYHYYVTLLIYKMYNVNINRIAHHFMINQFIKINIMLSFVLYSRNNTYLQGELINYIDIKGDFK